jgi:transitional endoplasmic reticulum ATPase
VPLPDADARKEVFRVHTTGVKLDKSVKIEKLVERTDGYSGADIEALVRKAGMLAIKDIVDKKTKESEVSMKHFEEALKKIRPSVIKDDIAKLWRVTGDVGQKDVNVA